MFNNDEIASTLPLVVRSLKSRLTRADEIAREQLRAWLDRVAGRCAPQQAAIRCRRGQ
jgi:hypothetical protein